MRCESQARNAEHRVQSGILRLDGVAKKIVRLAASVTASMVNMGSETPWIVPGMQKRRDKGKTGAEGEAYVAKEVKMGWKQIQSLSSGKFPVDDEER